jgi:hypothetical protein
MDTQTYQILIDSSYDELPSEAKYYVNRLVLKTSKKPFVSKILKGYHSSAIKSNNVDVLLSGAFIDSNPFKRAGCFWYLKIKIFLSLFSLLTGIVIPELLKKNFCLFLQSVVIASYYIGSNKSSFD